VSAANTIVGPYVSFFCRPYSWSINAWISKGSVGGHLFVKNTAGIPLYITIDAFKVG
jgi:hypothetical protein